MAYVNVGAYVNAERPKTKKALKEAVAKTPDLLDFDATSFEGPAMYQVKDLTPGLRLQVVGPDPYSKRSWYATVELKGGRVVVS